MIQRILSVGEEQVLYQREDGTYFSREDIYVKLPITFRDEMLAKLKGPKLSVFICIALHCNKEMSCFPSINKMAEETGYSDRAVITAIAELCEMGLITKDQAKTEEGEFINNTYRVQQIFTREPKVVNNVRDVVNVVHDVVNDVHTKKIPYKKNIDVSNETSVEATPQRRRRTPKPKIPTGDDSSTAEKSAIEEIMPAGEWRSRRWELGELFAEKAQVPIPKNRYTELGSRWWNPLQDILIAAGDMDTAKQVMEQAINLHIEKRFALYSPQSIQKTAISFAGEIKRGSQSTGGWRQG